MMTPTMPAAISQPAIPELTTASVDRLLIVATEAIQNLGSVAKHIISTSPQTVMLDGLRDDLTALQERVQIVINHCDCKFSRYDDRCAAIENRVHNLVDAVAVLAEKVELSPQPPLTPTPTAPTPPAATTTSTKLKPSTTAAPAAPPDGSNRTHFTIEAEARLRKSAIKREGFRESVYQHNLSRCTGELKRLYKKDVRTTFNRDQRSTTVDKKWANEYELIDCLNLGEAFRDIVCVRFFADK